MMPAGTPGRSARLHVPEPLIIAIAVLLVGSIAASFVDRLGAPTLLVFLGLGMLLGEDGPGGIQFDNATLARDAGTVALMIILLEGGLLAERSEVMRALGPAGLLATARRAADRRRGCAGSPRLHRPGLDHGAPAGRRGVLDRCRSGLRRAARDARAAARSRPCSRPRAGSTIRSPRCS